VTTTRPATTVLGVRRLATTTAGSSSGSSSGMSSGKASESDSSTLPTTGVYVVGSSPRSTPSFSLAIRHLPCRPGQG
jgi:hypothetical protein